MSLNIIKASVIAVSIILIYYIVDKVRRQREFLEITASDGETYHVLEDYEGKKETAEMFARINVKLLKFLELLKKKYKVNHAGVTPEMLGLSAKQKNLHDIVDRIVSNYDFESLFETEPTGRNGTSYTVEKGEELHMCARNKDTLKLHTEHEIMFVAIHELAHMGNLTWGHDESFWEIFKFLLYEADLADIHEPINYSEDPMVYCGLLVDYNPLFDPGCKKIW